MKRLRALFLLVLLSVIADGCDSQSGHTVAVYNNTTDQDIDSMAVMYLYLHDTNWHIPQRKRST
jgi:hypothetical protein